MRKLRAQPAAGRRRRVGYGGGVKDSDRDEAVEAHLGALDDEIARLRKMEAALDKRIAAADAERRAIEEGPGRHVEETPPEQGGP